LNVDRRLVALLLASAAILLGGCDKAQVDASVAAAPAANVLAAEETPNAPAASDLPMPAPPSVPQVAVAPVQNPLLVALDPGHGGDEVGAAANGVVERDSNLDMARRVERFLREGGAEVLLTRADAGRAPGTVPSSSGSTSTRGDLQARVRAANAAGAAVFVSLHSNGSPDLGQRGIEVYYESRREFADENRRLAVAVLDGALQGLSSAGYASRNRGVIDAACWRNNNGRCIGLFVLSPAGAGTSNSPSTTKEATNMPAVLAELLFISNYEDAALLRSEVARDAMARGVANGILRYLEVAN
jgi:N-acetylmuramoyl-L-alanine amidase